MDEERSDPGDIPTSERVRDVGTAMMSRVGQKITGNEGRDQSGAAYRLSEEEVAELTRDWPRAPSNLVEQMLRQHGPPNEGTPARLIWYHNGPWKRTELTRNELPTTSQPLIPTTLLTGSTIQYRSSLRRTSPAMTEAV